jgi:SSS family transporter
MTITLAVVLIGYFALILGVAISSHRRTRTEVDFLAAGRSIGPFVGGAVLAATQISAGTVVGTLGRHYLTGVSFWWIWLGVWAGWLVSAFFVAPRLRRFGALTVPDYIGARFGSEGVRVAVAALIIITNSVILVAQFQASGEIARAVFGMPALAAMLAIVASTAVYSMLGGVRSSSYIELIQALIMVVGLAVAVPVLLYRLGGVAVAHDFLGSLDGRLLGWYYGPREIAALAIAFSFSIAVSPYELTRFYSMRDERTVQRAIGVSIGFQALIGLAVLALGLLTRALFPTLLSEDQASSVMAYEVLPPIIAALLLVAMLSAIMSTVNSILLVTGAAISHDLYGKLRPRATDREKIRVNRLAILGLSVVPVVLALQKLGNVQGIVVLQTKFVASFFFAPVVIGLNWRHGTAAGAVASMVGGFGACLGWELTGQAGFSRHGIDSVEVGVAVSILLFFLVSRLTKPSPSANLATFFPERAP